MEPSLSVVDIASRLGAAVLVGALLGLDRELRNKPAGLRTIALVALGTATLTVAAVDHGGAANADAVSRVIQGTITGVGFIGAGTILHRETSKRVRGLTTAASIWLAAALGIASGLAHWSLVLIGICFGFGLLLLSPLEDWINRKWGDKPDRSRAVSSLDASDARGDEGDISDG